jgi:uncharacterized protein
MPILRRGVIAISRFPGPRILHEDVVMLNEELLALLVCPMGKAPLRREGDVLVCTRCGPRFAIKDDIPNMLIDEAELPTGCAALADLPCVKSGEARLD